MGDHQTRLNVSSLLRELTSLSQLLLVIDNRDILLGKVHDLVVLYFPKSLRNLTDKTC